MVVNRQWPNYTTPTSEMLVSWQTQTRVCVGLTRRLHKADSKVKPQCFTKASMSPIVVWTRPDLRRLDPTDRMGETEV